MHVYVTKYALTKGIEKAEARQRRDDQNCVSIEGYSEWWFITIGKDCFLTLEEAQADAEKQRKRKLSSLKKQIERINALKF